MSVPKLRFYGFNECWPLVKLGECLSERIESMPEGQLLSVTINDGIRKFAELERHDNSNDDKSKYKKVCVGDIAYNSMRMWQGASGYSPYEGIVSPAYTIVSPKKHIDARCMSYLFKSESMIHTFKLNSQGITSDTWNLKYPVFSEIEAFVSSNIDEQIQIGALFYSLDSLITQNQQKLEKLQTFKKSMLQKLFPQPGFDVPEIRFEGFSDPWTMKDLKSEVDFYSGLTYSPASVVKTAGTLVLRSCNIKNDEICTDDNVFVLDSVVNVSNVKTGDIIVVVRNGSKDLIGKHALVKQDMPQTVIGAFMAGIRSRRPDFINALFSTGLFKAEVGKNMGATINQITGGMFKSMTFMFPSSKEQQTIGNYFYLLDSLISLQSARLDKLRTLKKSLLERMFC